MDVIKRVLVTLIILFLLTAFKNGFAQSKPNAPGSRVLFHFDKPITLDSLTRYVHSRSQLRFSFNSTKVKGGQLIDLKKGTYTIDQLLQQIRKNTSLYYSVRNGYVIFQDNPPKPKATPPTVTKPTVTKPTATKPAAKKPAATKPQPITKVLVTDTTKKIFDSTKIPDSIKVFLPIKPRTHNGIDTTEYTENESRLLFRRRLILSLGRKPIDTTIFIIDTLNKKDTSANTKPTLKAASGIKKEKVQQRPTRTPVDNSGPTYWDWQYGLQWKATLPLSGSLYYLTGTSARSEPYNLLIPGAWLSVTANGRHEVMLLVKPAEWYYYNKKNYRNDTTVIVDNSDSIPITILHRKAGTLLKTSGWYGSLQYNLHINENWMVGAGIGYHLRSGALIRQQSFKSLGDTSVTDSLFSMPKNTDTGKYLASSFISGKVEVAYHFKKLDVGATVMMPLTSPFTNKSLNQSSPLNVKLFVRWRIKRNENE